MSWAIQSEVASVKRQNTGDAQSLRQCHDARIDKVDPSVTILCENLHSTVVILPNQIDQFYPALADGLHRRDDRLGSTSPIRKEGKFNQSNCWKQNPI